MATGDAQRFELKGAIEQAQGEPPAQNRNLMQAAVADPHGLDERPVRVTINGDVLDTLHRARRIGAGAYAAGRTYQRLLEVSLAAPGIVVAAGGTAGSAPAHRDEAFARMLQRAVICGLELTRIRRLIGKRSEALLRCLLLELNPNTNRPWTLEQIAQSRSKHKIYAVSSRVCEALEDLAEHWVRVEVD